MELELQQYEILDAENRSRLGPLNLRMEAGCRCLVMGPTGAGKSLLLRGLAGHLPPYWKATGPVVLGGEPRAELGAPRLAWMPQDPLEGLGPWLKVGELFRLLPRAWRVPDAEARLKGLLPRLGLDAVAGLRERFPWELSGGQRQRVLLAMLLSCSPEWLLMDEPSAALDAEATENLGSLLEQLRAEAGFGWIWVTHSPELALRHADHLVVLDQGRCLEQGKPEDLFGAQGMASRLLTAARFS